jgi:hypothetical protein
VKSLVDTRAGGLRTAAAHRYAISFVDRGRLSAGPRCRRGEGITRRRAMLDETLNTFDQRRYGVG